jgi:Lrp/AsnC family leucine-responsive transcriptional regulator
MDKMNRAILHQLKQNSRKTWQQIGKEVHLTGQAVAARVSQMEDQGLITGYTLRQDNAERHFITVFMETSDFAGFELFLKNDARIESAYKVTGEGCYQLIFISQNAGDLEPFLNAMLSYGRYKVATAIRHIKS